MSKAAQTPFEFADAFGLPYSIAICRCTIGSRDDPSLFLIMYSPHPIVVGVNRRKNDCTTEGLWMRSKNYTDLSMLFLV